MERTQTVNDRAGRPWLVAHECSKNACSKCCYAEQNKAGYYVCHADRGMRDNYIPRCDASGEGSVGFDCYFTKYKQQKGEQQ